MNSASISNISSSTFSQAIQQRPEARETGPERDHDADDAKKANPQPTVNLNGQSVGQLLNVSA